MSITNDYRRERKENIPDALKIRIRNKSSNSGFSLINVAIVSNTGNRVARVDKSTSREEIFFPLDGIRAIFF